MSTVEREVIAREETRELKERVIEINRVAKVVKGGRRFSFTALVVIGDEVDRVGVGYGKAREVPLAISKAVDDAKKNLFTVPKHGTTITHEILGTFGAARVFIRPASRGNRRDRRRRRARRARARRHPRRAREEPGHDESDQHGEGDGRGPQGLRRPEDVAQMRGKTISEILPPVGCRLAELRAEEAGRARARDGSAEARVEAAHDEPGWSPPRP